MKTIFCLIVAASVAYGFPQGFPIDAGFGISQGGGEFPNLGYPQDFSDELDFSNEQFEGFPGGGEGVPQGFFDGPGLGAGQNQGQFPNQGSQQNFGQGVGIGNRQGERRLLNQGQFALEPRLGAGQGNRGFYQGGWIR